MYKSTSRRLLKISFFLGLLLLMMGVYFSRFDTAVVKALGSNDRRIVVGNQEEANCFDYYEFQKINISLSPTNQAESTFLPGETLELKGTVENNTKVSVPQGQIKYRLVKVNPDETARRTDGDQIYDDGTLLENINLQVGEIKEIEATYHLPKVLSGGDYRLNFYFTQNNQFNWSGLFFSDEVIGNFLSVKISAPDKPLPVFLRGRTTVNDKKHNHIGFINKPYDLGEPLIIQTVLSNPSPRSFSGKILVNLYYWDQQQGKNLLDQREEVITLSAGEEKPLSYTVAEAEETVYLLEQTFRTTDSEYKLPYEVKIFTRVGVLGSRGRLNSLGLSKFPLRGGEETAFFLCYHNTSDERFKGEVVAELKDRDGRVLADLRFKGDIAGQIQAIKRDIKFNQALDVLVVSGKITNEQGKVVDEGEMIYDCTQYDSNLCSQASRGRFEITTALSSLDLRTPLLFFIGLLVIVVIVAGFLFFKRRGPKGLVCFGLFFLVSILTGIFFPQSVSAQWSSQATQQVSGMTSFRAYSWAIYKNVWYVASIHYTASAPGNPVYLNVGETVTVDLERAGELTATGSWIDTPMIYFGQSPPPRPCVGCSSGERFCGSSGTVLWCQCSSQLCQDAIQWAKDPANNHFDGARYFEFGKGLYGVGIGSYVENEPYLDLTSTNPSVLTCSGDTCRAVGGGTADIQVKVPQLGIATYGLYYITTVEPDFNSTDLKEKSIPQTDLGTITVYVTSPNQPPNASCGEVTNITNSSATLSWGYSDPDGDPQSAWAVQGSRDPSFSFLDFDVSGNGSQSSVNVGGLASGTTYYWRVAVKDSQENWSSWTSCGDFTTNAAPFGFLDKPVNDETVSGTYRVQGWALDDVGVTRVEVYIDGAKKGDAIYGSSRGDVCNTYPGYPNCPNVGFYWDWDTTIYANGGHRVYAKAYDAEGLEWTSDERVVTVRNNNQPGPPTELRTNNQVNPTGLLGLPFFSAVFNDPDTGDLANGYQLQVREDGSSSDFSNNVWDSGESVMGSLCISATRCQDISYAGLNLIPGGKYYWRIKYRDANGLWSPWSAEVAYFEMEANGTLTGYVWSDNNANCIRDADEENYYSLVRPVILRLQKSGVDVIAPFTTNNISSPGNNFTKSGILYGDYELIFSPPSGWRTTTQETIPVTINPGEVTIAIPQCIGAFD